MTVNDTCHIVNVQTHFVHTCAYFSLIIPDDTNLALKNSNYYLLKLSGLSMFKIV